MTNRSFPPRISHRMPPKVKWDARYGDPNFQSPSHTSAFLAEWLPQLPQYGYALDVAAGAGRHSIALARHGLHVLALDISTSGLWRLINKGPSPGRIDAVVLDLHRGWLPARKFDVIINFFYLERNIWPVIKAQLAPQGRLVMETLTVDQLSLPFKKHVRRNFLLEHDELQTAFSDLDIVFYDEGLHRGRYTAQLVAQKR